MNRRAALGTVVGVLSLGGCLDAGMLDEPGESEPTSDERADDESTDEGFIEARGEITIVIDGTSVDLSADRFQAEHAANHSMAFHLHEGDDYWYVEAPRRVTVGEAIGLLPYFEYRHEAGRVVIEYDGDVYDERDPGTTVEFVVNDEAVDPREYELYDSDVIRVEISTDE